MGPIRSLQTSALNYLTARNNPKDGGIRDRGKGKSDKMKRKKTRKEILNDLKVIRECWKLKEEALDRTLWRTRFGRDYRRVVRETTV
jgi:hypothetical protein